MELMDKIKQFYGRDLDMSMSNGDFLAPLRCQEELNLAIDMVDRSPHMRSLRVFLSLPPGATMASSPTTPPGLRLFQNQSTVSGVAHSRGGERRREWRSGEGRSVRKMG